MELFGLLTDTQVDTLQSNGDALGFGAGALIGMLLDDHFGGLPVDQAGADSFKSVQEHVDTLEWMLTDGLNWE